MDKLIEFAIQQSAIFIIAVMGLLVAGLSVLTIYHIVKKGDKQ